MKPMAWPTDCESTMDTVSRPPTEHESSPEYPDDGKDDEVEAELGRSIEVLLLYLSSLHSE